MNKYVLLFIVLCFGTVHAQQRDSIKLTDTQFENLEYIKYAIQQRYPEFNGFYGSKNEMYPVGLDVTTVKSELKNIDIPTAREDHPAVKEKKRHQKLRQSIIEKLIKNCGFLDNEAEYITEQLK